MLWPEKRNCGRIFVIGNKGVSFLPPLLWEPHKGAAWFSISR